MKLSEAIREGAKSGPQHFGDYFDCNLPTNGTCAVGAALTAAGWPLKGYEIEGLSRSPTPAKIFPVLAHVLPHPVSGERLCLGKAIYSLNDHHRWSREAIAEWVETVERGLGLWDEPAHDVMAEAQQTVKELTAPVPVQS